MSLGLDYTLRVDVPFENERQATIALKSLNPDPELKPDQLTRTVSTEGSVLVAAFAAVSDRVLRVGVNSFMDNVALAVECLDELDSV